MVSAEAGDGALIEARDLWRTYTMGIEEVHALHGVSFDIGHNEYVAVMGPSGSGKSTLLRCLNGLEEIDSGAIVIDGIPLDGDRKHLLEIRKEVGMVFQSFNLFPHLKVVDNVGLAQRVVLRKDRDAIGETTMALLRRVGLETKADRFPAQLSGGEMQRVAIARALVNRPSLLLADEPTGNLDSRTSVDVIALFQELNDQGITVVLVTHEPDIADCAKRIVTMCDGRILEDRPVVHQRIARQDLLLQKTA